jgi:hypothetical protein
VLRDLPQAPEQGGMVVGNKDSVRSLRLQQQMTRPECALLL